MLSQDDMKGLERMARCLRADHALHVMIEGNADERGTEEYNRGLGEKRAQAVRDALISMGLSGGKIQTVSFGEEMPADPGSGDSAWAMNRRAEFGVVK